MPQTGTLLLLGAMYSVTALGLLRSYTYIPSSVATTINFLYPLGVAIVMTLFFREKFRLAAGCDPHLTGGCGAAFVGRYRRSAERPCHRRRRVRGSDRADLHDLYRRCEKSRISRLDPMIQLFMSCFSAPASSSCTLCPRPVLRCPASGISGKTSCYWPWCRPSYPT